MECGRVLELKQTSQSHGIGKLAEMEKMEQTRCLTLILKLTTTCMLAPTQPGLIRNLSRPPSNMTLPEKERTNLHDARAKTPRKS